ncbi:GDSL esterase/lipase At2g40250-like [Typha angustifolia]|uniref:GDSL esterase/lipase At2g40250-like n=1 Tax=Typha angustifolia TaxID=59011 RepID=UPI003C2BBE36
MQKMKLSTFFFLVLLISTIVSLSEGSAQHNISAVFAFGDSTLDAGNNNHLSTFVKASHPPYGVDFPNHVPTGRFSDGKLITDFLVSSLGLKDFLPPYNARNSTSVDLATGVSFASAGSGFDDLTAELSNVETIGVQVENFKAYVEEMKELLGEEKVKKIVQDAMFVIGAGSNDLMVNYYLIQLRSKTYTLHEYHSFLLGKLQSLIKQLYNMGARKFAVSGLPPIGCIPLQMTLQFMQPGSDPNPTRLFHRTCIEHQNEAAVIYNAELKVAIERLQASLGSGWFRWPPRDSSMKAKIAYVDIYEPLMDMINNPTKYGFVETTRGCCGSGLFEMGPLCNSRSLTCPSPSKFMFWDSVHPSQATYKALADHFMRTVLAQFIN